MGEMTLQQAFVLASEHYNAGRLTEAEKLFQRILAAAPDHPDVLQMLAIVMHRLGRGMAGIELLRRAIDLYPDSASLHSNLGIMFASIGELPQGEIELRKAIALQPDFAEAHSNLGNILKGLGRGDEALAEYRQAVAINPDYVEARNNLGALLQSRGQPQDSLAELRRAVEIQPTHIEAHNNLGNALQDLGRLDEAVEEYHRALALRPDYPDAHYNLGSALRQKNRLNDAMAEFRKAAELRPQYAEAMWGMAFLRLLQGDFAGGWPLFEARLRLPGRPLHFELHEPWDGGPLNGRSILLHYEQGIGDTIQFARYIPMLRARGAGRIVLACQPQLRRLLSGQLGTDQIICEGDVIPTIDTRLPLLSLPRIFGTTVETIPAQVPYLRADPNAVEAWRIRLAQERGKRRIGIVWAGNRRHINDRNRSVPLPAFADISKIPDVRLVSLQKGPAATELRDAGIDIIDWTSELRDMADTAALVANLDLIISVDTSVAHLAGAMAKPVWTLIPFGPDWRWMLDRSDSPWYPTMRLFRQAALHDWNGPLTQVTEQLRSG